MTIGEDKMRLFLKLVLAVSVFALGGWAGAGFYPSGLWLPLLTTILLVSFFIFCIDPLTYRVSTNDHDSEDAMAIVVFAFFSIIAIIVSWIGFFYLPLLATGVFVTIFVACAFFGWLYFLLSN